jgi:nicotinate-nucleotide pyrophosphorylase
MKLLDASKRLTPKDKNYQKELKKHTFDAFYRDFGKKGDITSNILIDEDAVSKAFIIAKSEGILAGRQEIEWFLKQNKMHIEFHKKDGEKLLLSVLF